MSMPCRVLQDATAWGILTAAAAEHGTSRVRWSGISGQEDQMPDFADQYGVREEASILSQPVLLPGAFKKQQGRACLSKGNGLLQSASKSHSSAECLLLADQ